MATSILMASSDPTTNLSLADDHHNHHLQTTRNDDDHQTCARKTSNRRKNSSRASNENPKKKQPQRGMGVAQLERLRLQERWKKMTEINPTTSGHPLTTPLDSSSFLEPNKSINFPKFGGIGSTAGLNGEVGVDLNLMQQGLIVQTQRGGNGGLFQYGQGFVSDDKFQGYLYGIGNMNGGCSKELPSTPKVLKCYSTTDHCADCHKKKRIISSTGENLVFNGGVKDIYPHLPSITGCDFMGLKIGSSQNFKGLGNTDLDQKQPTSSFGFSPTEQQGVEVVGVGSKKKGSSEGIIMEYEFFPGNESSDEQNHHHHELLMKNKKKKKMMMMREERGGISSLLESSLTLSSSSVMASSSSTTSSTSIDLSLRLSYY